MNIELTESPNGGVRIDIQPQSTPDANGLIRFLLNDPKSKLKKLIAPDSPDDASLKRTQDTVDARAATGGGGR